MRSWNTKICAATANDMMVLEFDFVVAERFRYDLGASTPEAEENCAKMAAKQVRDFLEKGAVVNSVNFPECRMEAVIPGGGMRLCVANRNEPNMIGQMATVLADEKLNVSAMVNQNRNDLAYNLIDVEGEASPVTLDRIVGIDGVLSVRVIFARG